ncbi:hypothetical protein FAM09_23670 [Niastella caeni]|uniref:Teneurin-like YD-shell domain-containing protein n=1 Tax=Niastella caeni TaxID=2569763 RepID=A0A4S8HIE6_9BACT|nr:FG-GAP-like repeat-containing protein [Niastella caeni]THU34988.1 hypothetical protein FAM09_23670 [Niastella caeni]
MKPYLSSCIKDCFFKLIITVALVVVSVSAKAQCYANFSLSRTYPYGQLCSPQNVTVRAQHYNPNPGWVDGEFRWYRSNTAPDPVQTNFISSDYILIADYSFYATNGSGVWVSFYDYATSCESPRIPYILSIGTMPNLSQTYARVCDDYIGRIQLGSNVSGVTFQLYYFDQSNTYQLLGQNTTGYFELPDYSIGDEGRYFAKISYSGCSSLSYYPLHLEVIGSAPPTITGNLSILVGNNNTLTASGSASTFNWYDAGGNLLKAGLQYTMPNTLTGNTYTYQVRGRSSDGACFTNPAYVTVTVSNPAVTYTTPYTSSNFTKSIDLSKPVGTVSGTSGTTAAGGATYSIPIYTPPGANGIQPSVSVVYNSMSGNGNVGLGWNISGLSAITRFGKNMYHNGVVAPVSYTNQDGFSLDGARLNAISGTYGAAGTVYATEREVFFKIISYGSSANNPDWFKVTTKDGTIMEYGNTTDSRMRTDNGANVMVWRLNKIIDINGNYISFKYDNGFRDSRIDEINYTGNDNTGLQPFNKLKFNYQTREDRTTSYEGGASLASRHLLKSIVVTSEGSAVKTYQFNYAFDNLTSLLKEVIESGTDGSSLNSTIFLYGDQPQNMVTQTTVALEGSYDFFSGDFDADGKSDLLAAETYLDANMGIRLHSNYSLIKDVYEYGYTFIYNKTLPQNIGSQVIQDKKFFNFLTADYNGDGRDDVLEVYSSTINVSPCNGYRRKVSGGSINYTKNINNQTGYTAAPFDYPTDVLNVPYQYVSEKGHFFIPGDFDGDGNKDYILLLGKPRQNGTCVLNIPRVAFDYKAFLTSPSTNETNAEIANFGFGATADYYAGTVAGADMLNTLDFDGDGKTEILVTKDNLSYVIRIQRVSATSGFLFGASVIYTTGEITKTSKIYPGDFNSDHKTDILVRNSSGSWKILYGTGTSFTVASFTFNQTPNLPDDHTTDKIIVSDFNGDGNSDIMHGFRVTGTGTSKISMYYFRGVNSGTPFYYEQYNYNNLLAYGELTVGDFNGDGRSDLLNRPNVESSADFISFKPFGKERLLAKVTNGHNVTVEFQYRNLTDESTFPYVYSRTISLDSASNKNPFNYIQLPIYVISALITPNGIGGTSTTMYNYENAILHRAAKGFLGFKKTSALNLTTRINVVTEIDLNTQFATLYNVKVASLTSTGDVLGESITTSSFSNLSTGNLDKRYFQKIDKVLDIDFVKGSASETLNTYDSYGNIVTNVLKTGTLSGSSVNAVESSTSTITYSIHNTPVPAKPDQVTVVKSRAGATSQSNTTQYTYTSTGLLLSQTDFYGLPKAVTTTYSYNGFGNPAIITLSATGVNNRVSNLTYDSKGRFVISKTIAAGTPIAQTESFTYDGKWGKPLSMTTSDCITVQYEYDVFGQAKKTIEPAFTAIHSLVWDVQGNNVYYSLVDYSGGKPDTKAWFDKLNRETKKQVAGFNNQWLNSAVTYDVKGNVASNTNTYYSTETPITTTNTYDGYNRLRIVSNPLNTINYNYNMQSGGNVQVTATDQAGQTNNKTTDAAGKIIAGNDKGGSLTFTYDSRGAQTEVKHGGNTIITNTYDAYGRKTSQVDKNAGTITYEYDALGQLKQQTDNTNHTYQMSYDELGRVISRQGPEGVTTYEYYKDNETGCSNNKLQKVTGFNGVIKEYTYDNLKRLQSEKVTIAGITYITMYSYDAYSRVNKVTYPSGVEVNNVYDNNGLLTSVTGGNTGAQTTLFTVTKINGYGRYIDYTLGNNKSSQITYQNGFPTHYYTQGVQDLNFTWDYAKGNLSGRQEVIKGVTESFQYDALNRLTQTSVNNQVQLNLSYDGNSTFSMGNIVSKTDAGEYTYKTDKIHAVAYITNPAGSTAPPVTTSQTEQTITYTPFLKTATINEQPYQIAFTYGPDYQRVKSELQTNGVLTETRLYIGNYEKQTDNTGAKEIHYVYGGNGLCAIIVRQNGVNNFYVTYTDHLGSILTLTDLNGNIVVEQNFDAWGRKRNPQNWTYSSIPSVPGWLNRGYTGHEHLAQFALINMNGRLYDPVQGRMLSPDNYIPGAFSTQGYNRYAYGHNNPMSYVDPDGNFPWLIVGMAALFALGNTATHAMGGDIDNFGDGLKYFAQGAITGAALGAGITFGLPVPVVGPIIKGAAFVYAVTTKLSFVSAAIRSIVKGDLTPLANAGKIFAGNFYLDENKSFFGGVWEGVSRFTWQLPQTTIGHASAAMLNTFGGVRSVGYYGGATVVETNRDNWGGITQGSFIIGDRGIRAKPNDPLFQHEYGHYIQSQLFGPLYYGKVGIPSVLSKDPHELHPAEQDANARAFAYFNKHVPGYAGWDFGFNPIINTGYRLGFHWFDVIDPLGIINTIFLNRQY